MSLKIGYHIKYYDPKDTKEKVGLVISFDENMMVVWNQELGCLYPIPRIQQVNEEAVGGDIFYYMQDKRQYVGNSMYWWAKNARGYTCDIRKAIKFTLEEAKKYSHRETDILWPKDYIDDRISHHIDMQLCDPEAAKTICMDPTMR